MEYCKRHYASSTVSEPLTLASMAARLRGEGKVVSQCNVGITINHEFGNGLYQLSMVILGMVYCCYTHIINGLL